VTGAGQPEQLDVTGATAMRVAVVASLWHEEVMAGLLAGAQRALDEIAVADVRVQRVPGSFELPLAALVAARAGFDVVVALGVVVRGGTPHFEYVCATVSHGLSRVALDTGVPVGFGLLTCDDEAQAMDRAGLPGSKEDKGYEAAWAAVAAASAINRLRT